MGMQYSNGPELTDVPHEVMAARDQIAAAIQRNLQNRPTSRSARAPQEVDNVRGVAIGLGGADTGSDPGEPVVNVYMTERTTPDDIRSVLVDAMEVRSAGDMSMRFITSGVIRALDNKRRIRPAPAGFSVGYGHGDWGTLGCLATGDSGERSKMVLLLSCNHVIADLNNGAIGDCITQPGYSQGGDCPDDEIATLERFVPLVFDGSSNYVDCATGRCWVNKVRTSIGRDTSDGLMLKNISHDIVTPRLGMQVGKVGASTQLTRGVITGIQWSGTIGYGDDDNGLDAYFTDQIAISKVGDPEFSTAGDSGSCIWEWEEPNRPVGLLFAGASIGSSPVTLANPMYIVMDELEIDLFT